MNLKDEVTIDPLLRGYAGMTDDQVAADGHIKYRPNSKITIEAAIKFLLMDNTHKTDGDDTQDRSIWQRMKEVAAMGITPAGAAANPWGSTAIGTITEIQQVKTHQLLEFFTLSAQGDLEIDLEDSKFQVYLTGVESAGCMSLDQKVAFLALADNLQTRWQELGLGNVKAGHVGIARN